MISAVLKHVKQTITRYRNEKGLAVLINSISVLRHF